MRNVWPVSKGVAVASLCLISSAASASIAVPTDACSVTGEVLAVEKRTGEMTEHMVSPPLKHAFTYYAVKMRVENSQIHERAYEGNAPSPCDRSVPFEVEYQLKDGESVPEVGTMIQATTKQSGDERWIGNYIYAISPVAHH